MTGTQWIVIAAEAAAIIGLIIGFCNHKRICAFETRQINRAKRWLRKRLGKLLETTPTDPADGREVWGTQRQKTNENREETNQ